MYLTRVRLKDFRLFEYLDIPFASDEGVPRPWTLLLGDNATGKTTLLLSIAIGLCDESSAAGLVRELKSLLRRGARENGAIQIELLDAQSQPWTIQTEFHKIDRMGERVRQKIFDCPIDQVPGDNSEGIDPDDFSWKKLFVVGYGAGRTTEGREEYGEYRAIDAVYTLFRYDQPLQSPELVWRRLLDTARRKAKRTGKDPEQAATKLNERVKAILHDVLLLSKKEEIDLDPTGIRFIGPGYSVPLSAHADGYKATTTWVLDMLAWRMLFDRMLSPKQMKGIVLVDEIEQHLHPRWQRYIVTRLKQQFPRLQFIATTHSPLCSGGAGDLPEKECTLIALSRDGKKIERDFLPSLRGLRADQILTSDAFRLAETRSPEIGEKVERFRELFGKRKLSEPETQEMDQLRRFIFKTIPEAGQFEEERRLRDELRHLIEQIEERLPKDRPK